MDLLTQDQLEAICPFFVEELTQFIAASPEMQDRPEAVIYALGQTLHNHLKTLDLKDMDKGFVVATLIKALAQFNEIELAVYRALQDTMLQQKTSTIH